MPQKYQEKKWLPYAVVTWIFFQVMYGSLCDLFLWYLHSVYLVICKLD